MTDRTLPQRAREVLAAYPYLANDWRFGTLIADVAVAVPCPGCGRLSCGCSVCPTSVFVPVSSDG